LLVWQGTELITYKTRKSYSPLKPEKQPSS
jgi:hypothetical protein